MYRQSSANRIDAAEQDKNARWYWRFPPRRLNAEEIRDTLLVVAGKMQFEPMGGPGFRLYKFTQNNVCTYIPLDQLGAETYRRSVYHQNARASVVDVLSDFDLPDIAFSAPKRVNTTTPLQALTLLNHSFSMDMAKALANRIGSDTNKPETDCVQAAYELLYQRSSSQSEFNASVQFIRTHGQIAFCRALLNTNELIYLD
jgi:hypothetical protein